MNDTKIDAGAARDGPTRLFDESLVLLAHVQTTLVRKLRALDAGDVAALDAFDTRYAELEVALKRAFEMERMVNDWKQDQRGSAARPATAIIDFDRARHDIGCRLARLRACCSSD